MTAQFKRDFNFCRVIPITYQDANNRFNRVTLLHHDLNMMVALMGVPRTSRFTERSSAKIAELVIKDTVHLYTSKP